MVTDLQKSAAMAIVNVFETGGPHGDYGKVTLLAGDSGHLTYGRSQTTLASGNLFLLVKAYCAAQDARFVDHLSPYLERLAARDVALDDDENLKVLLREAGDDPVMQAEQDAFFDRLYWEPAIRSCEFVGVGTALGTAVVYDSRVHGSWHSLRDHTIDRHGTLEDIGEQQWIPHYVELRHGWLANNPNRILRRTVYRMEAFRRLIGEDNWDLALPFTVRGAVIDEAVLTGGPPLRASAEVVEERLLRLRRPFMQGTDVRELQQALTEAGIAVAVDGMFGPATEAAVRNYQGREGLVADGIVGAATRSHLGL